MKGTLPLPVHLSLQTTEQSAPRAAMSPPNSGVYMHRKEKALKRFVEFSLEDGSTIVVEVNEPEEEHGTRRAARGSEEQPERAAQTFEQALSKIRPATEKVITTLRGLMQKPDEIEMEFGFSLNAGTGVIIASVSTEANYKVTLRWKGTVQERSS